MEWRYRATWMPVGRRPIQDVFVADLALRYRPALRGRLHIEPNLLLRNFLDRRYDVEGYTMPGFNMLLGLKLET